MMLWMPIPLVAGDGSLFEDSLVVVSVVVIVSGSSGSSILTLSACNGFQEGHRDWCGNHAGPCFHRVDA